MYTMLADRYVEEHTTVNDLQIASLAWGFTIGFGFLTVWKAIQQTASVHRRYGFWKLNTPYIWMIWLEILVCLIFSIICWLHLNKIIPPSFAFYFVILTTWALQVQFLLQIIINRVSILLVDRRKALRIKVSVAVLITAINISVYAIWIPARLQVSERYEHINEVWDRCEKVIYLLVDAALNWYFIRTVKKELVDQGLTKYDRLVRFNVWIIGFSLAMDFLIIGTMSLNNSFVYMQFHPFAYMVKLNIEMSMADLITTVSKSSTTIESHPHSDFTTSHTQDHTTAAPPTLTSKATFSSNLKHKNASSFAPSSTRTSFSDEIELHQIDNLNSSRHSKGGVLEVNVNHEIHTHVESTVDLVGISTVDLTADQITRNTHSRLGWTDVGGDDGEPKSRGGAMEMDLSRDQDRKVDVEKGLEMGVRTKVFV